MSGYEVVVCKRTQAEPEQYELVHREPVTPQTLVAFRSGELLRRVQKRDDARGPMTMVRVSLLAPDNVELDTYVGPHPDEGPNIYQSVVTSTRRAIANNWHELVTGADPGPVPPEFDPDVRSAASYVAEHAREMR